MKVKETLQNPKHDDLDFFPFFFGQGYWEQRNCFAHVGCYEIDSIHSKRWAQLPESKYYICKYTASLYRFIIQLKTEIEHCQFAAVEKLAT